MNTYWEAIKAGLWDFLPRGVDASEVDASEMESSDGTPGAQEKLDVLTEHIRRERGRWQDDVAEFGRGEYRRRRS